MGRFQNAIRAFFEPQKKPTRKSNHLRFIQAAAQGRLESSWVNFPSTPGALINQNWLTLVSRSREQVLNNDYARRFISLVRENVAGQSGFKINVQITDPNGTPDYIASNAIEEAWDDWSKMGNFDVTGTLSRSAGERLAASTVAQDGECFAILLIGKEFGKWGFQVQFVDATLLKHDHFETLSNGNEIRHGIEVDQYGKPIAYHFQEQGDDRFSNIGINKSYKTRRVDAENVIHLFIPGMVGQKRGLPWMTTAIWKMRMLSGFEDAAVTNARIGAAKMGFFYTEGEDIDPEDDQTTLPMDAEAGVFENIGNRKLIQYDPQFPDAMFDPFVKALLRSIASGLGVSYNTLANDLTSVSYSSIRQGTLDEREIWKGLQEWMIQVWSERVYLKWIEYQVATGKIKINGTPLRAYQLEKYKRVSFRGRRWSWIDPQSEMTAYEKAIGNGLKSRTEIIEEMGREAEDVWQETARENKTMEGLGIKPLVPNSFIGNQSPNAGDKLAQEATPPA